MYNKPGNYQCPNFNNRLMQQSPYLNNPQNNNLGLGKQMPHQYFPNNIQNVPANKIKMMDYGPNPFVVNIEEVTKQNNTYRTALWTGEYLQLTLMSINVGDDIGLELHQDHDQFIRIEDGHGLVKMGYSKDNLDFQAHVSKDFAFIIPAGTWHNLINTGNKPIKLYSIYAPPQHPYGTVHVTKANARTIE